MPSPTDRWYHSVWFVLAMLFLVLGPLALPLLWGSPRFSRDAKIGLTIAVALYTLWLIAALGAATWAIFSSLTP